MALWWDFNESRIKEKEMIDADLQKMGESLQLLKTSVEKDETILTQADFSNLLQHIVADLSSLSPTSDMLILQNTLQSQESLTASALDKIIQQFISIKLQYTADKSIFLTDVSLQKYKQLIEHKSSMDDLLVKISKTNAHTPESTPVDWPEKEIAVVPEATSPVPEVLDLEVIKNQQALIDAEIISSVQEATKEDAPVKEEDKKSFWERAKESSFGLAFVFGADNMTSTKEWFSDRWDDFKELIGWKKKEKKEDKEDEKEESVVPETQSIPEVVDINAKLTPEQITLRNKYIQKSVMDTTSIPVVIDYAWDKDVLVESKAPESISFDAVSQSIILGDAKLQLSFPEFTMKVDSGTIFGVVDDKVTKVSIQDIKVSWNEFIIDAKGTWSAKWMGQTKDMSITLSKEKFYDLLKPYLDTNAASYKSTIDINGEKIPLSIETSWSIERDDAVENPIFATYQSTLYNKYSPVDRWYLDGLGTTSKDMYIQATEWVNKGRLPPLLQKYDETVVEWLNGKTMAVVAESFTKVGDIIDDTFLQKIGTKTNDIIWWIIDFLSKHEDSKLLGWLAKIVNTWAKRVQWLVAGRHGDAQKEKNFRKDLENAFADNPALKKDIENTTKQLVLVRFYFTEKKALLAEKWIDVSTFGDLSIPQAIALLDDNDILNADISTVTQTGIEFNRMSGAIQEIIQATDDQSNFSEKRGVIKFNYETNELESRWEETKINIYEGGKYKIDGFDILFSDPKEVVRLANASNRLINQASLTPRTLIYDYFSYHNLWVRWGVYTGINQLFKKDTFEENVSIRSGAMGWSYATYLNSRFSILGKAAQKLLG